MKNGKQWLHTIEYVNDNGTHHCHWWEVDGNEIPPGYKGDLHCTYWSPSGEFSPDHCGDNLANVPYEGVPA